MKKVFNKVFGRKKFDALEMMIKGEVPSFEIPLTKEEKEYLINACLVAVAKPIMFAFYTCELQTHIESMIVNDANGDEFILCFKKLNKEQGVQVSDTTKV
jgi:hypothetical protein